MGRFIAGTKLSREIRELLEGRNSRCAVAFWGVGASELLSSDNLRDVRIICDIRMGNTSADALIELGAPTNKALRHKPYLHAKVYLSDRGVIVGSANASNNGIGFGGKDAVLSEAGMFDEPESDAWTAASDWFDTNYADAKQVDIASIELARAIYTPNTRILLRHKVRKNSLLDRVMTFPEQFDNIGFLVVDGRASDNQILNARKKAIAGGIESEQEINDFDSEDMIVGLDATEIALLPSTFVELYNDEDGVTLYYRTLWRSDRKARNIFAQKDESAVQSIVNGDIPSSSAASKADAALVRKLCLDKGAGLYPSGRHLAERLSSLSR